MAINLSPLEGSNQIEDLDARPRSWSMSAGLSSASNDGLRACCTTSSLQGNYAGT